LVLVRKRDDLVCTEHVETEEWLRARSVEGHSLKDSVFCTGSRRRVDFDYLVCIELVSVVVEEINVSFLYDACEDGLVRAPAESYNKGGIAAISRGRFSCAGEKAKGGSVFWHW
jgi:hypothetical protein